MQLFREGERVHTMPAVQVDQEATGAKPVTIGRVMRLAATFPAGDYQLLVTVTERTPGSKPRSATQWTDFSVVPR